MKKILILISILIFLTGGIALYSPNEKDSPKLKQVNVSNENADDNVVEESKKEEIEANNTIPEKKVEEEKKEIKSNPEIPNKDVSSASNSTTKNKEKKSVSQEVPTGTQKENSVEQPKVDNNSKANENKSNSQTPKSNVSTKFYDSITGGKKEFSSESEAFARGLEIQNNELDYVLDYNEKHPEAPIQPDINYFRVYPVIDDEGTGYYLHFFCVSGEGNDEKLKSMY